MQRTRSQWKEIVPDRLAFIYDAVIRKDRYDSVIHDLRSAELVSKYYDSNCLAVDVWYLFDRYTIYAHKRFAEIGVIRSPLIRLLFGIVIQAICDAKNRRPCDAHSWRLDHPPGDESRCTPTTHICEENAVQFIAETASVLEPVLNLSEGTLIELIAKENGSVKSRSQEIFNCTGQES